MISSLKKINCHNPKCANKILWDEIVCKECFSKATAETKRHYRLAFPRKVAYTFARRNPDQRFAIDLLLDSIEESNKQISLLAEGSLS